MVDVGAERGEDFDGLDPAVVGEMGGDDFVGVVDVVVGRDGDAFGHGEDFVRLGDGPDFGPAHRWGRVFGIAGGGVGGGPCGERGHLSLREGWVVGEVLADAGAGAPRVHWFVFRGGGDGGGVARCLGVGLERHGGDAVGAVAGLAVELEDGGDVAVEGGSCGGFSLRL